MCIKFCQLIHVVGGDTNNGAAAIINYQLSIINYQLSIINYQSTTKFLQKYIDNKSVFEKYAVALRGNVKINFYSHKHLPKCTHPKQ